jgi:hypothetical protein
MLQSKASKKGPVHSQTKKVQVRGGFRGHGLPTSAPAQLKG